MAVAIGIAALSLTVATVAAALDRKRTFALLRLGGMPSGDLRRVIAVEAGVPLVATLAISAGLGFFVAWLMVTTLGNGQTMSWPDARYWWAIVASVAIGAAAVMGSFSMVRRSTEVTSTRFE
jgi:ABC-type antimicrobial peptide transport system permease subunit